MVHLAGNLGCRIFDRPLSRLQPSLTIPVAVSLARLPTVLIVVSSDRVAGLAKRLLDNQPGRELDQQPGRELDQLIFGRSSGKTPFDQCR
jgi:hypothetical protein